MSVLLATDFSARALAAGDVAARIARAWNEPLVVAYVGNGVDDFRALSVEVDRLSEVCDARPLALEGAVASALEAAAHDEKPRIVVVGANGKRARSWIGSIAEALSARLSMPVLVVRDGRHLVRFLDEAREIKVLATESFDDTFPAARDALIEMAKLGPVHAVVGHWSFGLDAGDDAASLAKRRELHAVLAREMKEELDVVPGGRVDLLARDGLGRLDVLVCDLAREIDVDLVVCGTHQRRRLERLLEGSIAAGIVRDAPCSVLVAPRREAHASTSNDLANEVSSPA